MPVIESPSLPESVRTLPAGGGRERHLQRIVDAVASTEAMTALRDAAEEAHDGILGRVLTATDAVLSAVSLPPATTSRLTSVTVEGSAATLARERLRDAVTSSEFVALLPAWIRELRQIAESRPDSGACTTASALEVWAWSLNHFRTGDGSRFSSAAQALDELTEAVCPLIASRCLVLAADMSGDELRTDLSQVQAGRSAAAVGATCAELVFGYRRHMVWDAEGCAVCFDGEDVDDLEAIMPGIASGARMGADVVEGDGSHPSKRGPCASFAGLDTFIRLRARLDGCLTGARLAKDRAAAAIERSLS